MLYKATVSFCGAICAAMGDLLELSNRAVIKDLTEAGYIIKAESPGGRKPSENSAAQTGGEVNNDENVGNNAE